MTLGYTHSSCSALADTDWPQKQAQIDHADVLIVATLSTKLSPMTRNGDLSTPQSGQRIPNPITESLVFKVAEDHPGATTMTPARAFEEAQFARDTMVYARGKGKQVIHLSLRAPYDVVHYDDVANVSVATYRYYGYWRGVSLAYTVDLLAGPQPARGKLPVAIYDLQPDGSQGPLRYLRGFGLFSSMAQ